MVDKMAGKALERLVYLLEKQLSGRGDVHVESPKKCVDTRTGRLREHDVVVTIANSHHQMLVAIECRDRSRAVGVPQVEAFWAKCQHTNINQGIIVSTSGFTGTAREVASKHNIRCFDLQEAERFDWLLEGASVVFHSRSYKSVRCTAIIDDSDAGNLGEFTIFDADNNVVSDDIMKANIVKICNKSSPDRIENGVSYKDLRFETPGFFVCREDDSQKFNLIGILVRVQYEEVSVESPLKYQTYGAAKDVELAQVASCKVDFADMKGQVVLMESTKGRSIGFVPDK